MMKYAYTNRRRISPRTGAPRARGSAAEHEVPNSAHLAALSAGTDAPTEADKGVRVDLPEAMRAKMENAFGADFSGVKLYESQTVADAGAEAVTRGSSIAFAPGRLNLGSRSGQELLGHELSHVVSQQRGEVTGGGFLNDRALEARADREGAMAAAGESIYGGAAAPLSNASAAPAAGPMQAKKKNEEAGSHDIDYLQNENAADFQDKYSNPWKEYFNYSKMMNRKKRDANTYERRAELLDQGREEDAAGLTRYNTSQTLLNILTLPGRALKYGLMPILSPIGHGIKKLFTKKSKAKTADRAVADKAMANDYIDENEEKEDMEYEEMLRNKLNPMYLAPEDKKKALRRSDTFEPKKRNQPIESDPMQDENIISEEPKNDPLNTGMIVHRPKKKKKK